MTPQIVDIAAKNDAYGLAVRTHSVFWQTIRDNFRFFVSMAVIVAFFAILMWAFFFVPLCTPDKTQGCYSDTDRQWVQTFLSTLIGAFVGAALTHTSQNSSEGTTI